MRQKWSSVLVAVAMITAGSAYAQDTSGGATSAGSNSDSTATGAGAQPAESSVAPVQGPLPAGDEAGMTEASGFSVGPATIAVGAAALGGLACLAACGGGSGHGSTTTTTTTTGR